MAFQEQLSLSSAVILGPKWSNTKFGYLLGPITTSSL